MRICDHEASLYDDPPWRRGRGPAQSAFGPQTPVISHGKTGVASGHARHEPRILQGYLGNQRSVTFCLPCRGSKDSNPISRSQGDPGFAVPLSLRRRRAGKPATGRGEGFWDGIGDRPRFCGFARRAAPPAESTETRVTSGFPLRGERPDSNRRPPGPQPHGRSCDRFYSAL